MFSMSFHLFALCSNPPSPPFSKGGLGGLLLSALSFLLINPSLLLPLARGGWVGSLSALCSLLFTLRITSTFVATIPALFTFLACISYPSIGIFFSSFFSFSIGTPASTRAPRHISPLIPEKQSKEALL